jgi:hypothetical protein
LPSCNAVLISASLQFPMPLSRSGVMLVAQTSNGGSSKRNPPDCAAIFQGARRAHRNVDKIGVSREAAAAAISEITEQIGAKIPGMARKVPEFLPDCSLHVHARLATEASR